MLFINKILLHLNNKKYHTWYVPILLAVSPLAVTLSAPTTAAEILREFIKAETALSHINVAGIFSCNNSYAVNLAPWLNGLVSVQYTWSKKKEKKT